MIVQKITTSINDSFNLAFKYFSILSILNDLNLVKRDCQLMAFSIAEGKNVSEVKLEFVKKFGSSLATVGNIISKLYKLNILIKDKKNVKINPVLLIDFNKDLALGIVFKNGNKG